MSTLLEELLVVSKVASPDGEARWTIADDPAVTIFVEAGRGLVSVERVTHVAIWGSIAELGTPRETHYVPVDRIVGLKVAGDAAGKAGVRAGFV